MNNNQSSQVSRRHFLASACLACAAVWLAPRRFLAEDGSPVTVIRGAAATARITVRKLRGGVSVLGGSGGNIAVLTGSDGKVLVDAGITASRPGIAQALSGISPDPVKHLVNTHWHFDHTDPDPRELFSPRSPMSKGRAAPGGARVLMFPKGG